MVKKINSAASLDREKLAKLGPEDEYPAPDVIKIGKGIGEIGTPSTIIVTPEGVVVYDVGTLSGGRARLKRIRQITQAPIHTIIYSHGHEDHIGGAPVFLEDAAKRGYPRPRIIGHELLVKRLNKYKMLNGRRKYINSLQWSPFLQQYSRKTNNSADLKLPDFTYPDVTFSDYFEFKLGGLTFELHHAMGETDDAVWVWIPERKAALVSDLFPGGCPNTGNPMKPQRHTPEWADALEKIAAKDPAFITGCIPAVLPGAAAKQICLETAEFLRYIHDEVVRLLNQEYWIEDILAKIKIPERMANNPWLVGAYGHPTFVIHDVYRKYTGWYDGNPSHLFPSSTADIASEVTHLAKPQKLLKRARKLHKQGNHQLSLHLLDFVIAGSSEASEKKEAINLKADILKIRAEEVKNFIAGNVMRTSAANLRKKAEQL